MSILDLKYTGVSTLYQLEGDILLNNFILIKSIYKVTLDLSLEEKLNLNSKKRSISNTSGLYILLLLQ